jgi:hypothetical protein
LARGKKIVLIQEIFRRNLTMLLILATVIIAAGCTGIQPQRNSTLNGYLSDGLHYTLPLQKNEIINYDNVSGKILISPVGQQKLSANGFVVVNNTLSNPSKSIADVYTGVQNSEVPVFVTSDSALYIYHMAFEGALKDKELEFYRDLQEISRTLLDESVKAYDYGPENQREASRLNVAYFAVAVCLLYPDTAIIERQPGRDILKIDYNYFQGNYKTHREYRLPTGVADEIEQELAFINQHRNFVKSPIFHYEEDYSQYIPRGHYSDSFFLSDYFRAMTWYGRMSFILASDPDCPVVGWKTADTQTASALLITSVLDDNPPLRQKWENIYSVTSLFAGQSDDLGPNEYQAAMNTISGNSSEKFLINDTSLSKVRTVLQSYHSPLIYSGTGMLMPATPKGSEICLESTKGFRFMGQRVSPDAYAISRLIYPNVGRYTGKGQPFTYYMNNRGFPMGLDVMAILGSERARNILNGTGDSRYEGYDTEYQNIGKEFSSLREEDWNRDLYWGWLHSLQPVLVRKGSDYPTFMQTEAWTDKDLNTALASWTALRHDTLLYTKQNEMLLGVHPGPRSVPGYVEPVPELYYRLENLCRKTRDGLVGGNDNRTYFTRYAGDLDQMTSVYHKLGVISDKELNNEELSSEEYSFINAFGTTLKRFTHEDEIRNGPTLVADIYTQVDSGLVVEEGSGIAQLAVVAYKVPDGRILLGAGPVLPYYEFKQPIDQRLTDDQWWQMLKNNPPAQPNWTASFTAV